MELLSNGKAAFPAILRCIRAAETSVYVNMFIWRNDGIGTLLARELLSAAERGVRVTIVKDRYGVICECCEETRRSFFHRRQTVSEHIRIGALWYLYGRGVPPCPEPAAFDGGELYAALSAHPLVTVRAEENLCDHSKFWVFDDRILLLGGINIEDKENGCDLSGREYRDCIALLDDPGAVSRFLAMRADPVTHADPMFSMNLRTPVRYFHAEEDYLRLIGKAEVSLTVVMAYFSPLPAFETAILRAAERGVSVRVLIPEHANFQNDLNRKTVSRLRTGSRGTVRIFLSPAMVHTKLVMSEKTVSFGSANITKKAFRQLGELNLVLSASDDGFDAVRACAEALFSEAREIPLHEDIPFRRPMARAESFLV